MTNQQLDDAWGNRGKPNSVVAPGWIDGKGTDSDFMTIPFDGQPERTWERRVGSAEWREVPSKPVALHQLNA
jgi:hypothetical protein